MDAFQQIIIPVTDNQTREILIALLADAGYEGFTEERSELLAFIPESNFDANQLSAILDSFSLAYSASIIEQQNWNASWESSFQPVTVPGFCAVRANFHSPVTGIPFDIIVTPKMSFGTGHHATTFQMLEAMRSIEFDGRSVLDFGTGTGVLAILAEKMGAKAILAIDIDDWSIENAGENISRNLCSRIRLKKADRLSTTEQFDIILANINKNVVLAQLESMKSVLAPAGTIVVSGLLTGDAPELENAIAAAGLTLWSKSEKESWLCWSIKARFPYF